MDQHVICLQDSVTNTEAQVRSNNELQEQLDKLTNQNDAKLLQHQKEVKELEG